MRTKNRVLCLCAGLQSGGTTLISWCFLQRADMDGILDANNDVLADIPPTLKSPFAWIKTTIGCFRVAEQIDYFRDLGWTVRPLLVCRDVREAYASLRSKRYARNGTTAEDPPLRLRFRRFREDWELFRAKDWPIVRYDQFLHDPEEVLGAACAKLQLPWDDAMLTWPKPKSAIFDTRHGNETFHRHCGASLWESLRPVQASARQLVIPASEHLWLESEFAHFNQVNGYPAHLPVSAGTDEEGADIPSLGVTRRVHWRQRQAPLQYLLHRVGQWFSGDAADDAEKRPQPARAQCTAADGPRQDQLGERQVEIYP